MYCEGYLGCFSGAKVDVWPPPGSVVHNRNGGGEKSIG